MCGFAGILAAGAARQEHLELTVRRMADTLAHRGPDDRGSWADPEAGIALGHRRLSIIDLSEAGHQPMESASGRFVLAYNGEIYNHRDLRAELEAAGAVAKWRGHSDTEVMLAAFERWGVRGALERLNGMFAFALWDRGERTLVLARDRMGEKPLYYGRVGSTLLFGSELKAIVAHPDFVPEVDREALTAFLRLSYVPAPLSIWRGIFKLPPAHFLEVRGGGCGPLEPTAYWSLREVAERGAANPLPDAPERADELEVLLKDAVLRRMEADVPLGAFLSGGVDSSLIVALMQTQSARPVRTFTIGFEDAAYNEAGHAKAIARHLGTDHSELYVSPGDALDLLPRLPTIWDEPFADASQVPTYLVSELTRRHVTVSLSGDGGDELFGGYNRHVMATRLRAAGARIPKPLARLVSAGVRSRAGIGAASALMQLAPKRWRLLGLADRLPKIAHALEAGSDQDLYHRLISQIDDPAAFVIAGEEPLPVDGDPLRFSDFRQTMMYLDSLTYLPDDILTKVDRASMAVSLEARVPFLDHRVVELAWSLPLAAKIRDGQGKYILRQILFRHVPRELIERPKMGFGLPISTWLTGPLRGWAEGLLDERRITQDGFFRPGPVRKLWKRQLAGGGGHYQIWNLLMFQAWWAEHRTGPSRAARLESERLHA